MSERPAWTDLFINRPVLAIVLNLLILTLGARAISTLGVRQYPSVESSTITISTVYVGADAELVRGFITTPIERALGAVDGVDYIESRSAQGASTIQLRLALGVSAAQVLADVTARVNQVRAELPAAARPPAIRAERTDAQVAAMYLGFESDSIGDPEFNDYLERIARPRLNAVEGVQRVELSGHRTFALRVWLDPRRMAALGVDPGAVRTALERNHRLVAAGRTRATDLQINLTVTADLDHLEAFRDLIISATDGRLIRLRDIARVSIGAESYDDMASISGKPAAFAGVWIQPRSNALEVATRVRQALEALQAGAPAGVTLKVAYDGTTYIDQAIAEIGTTLIETIGIVIVVLFLFLGSLRTVLVPLVAIPLSLLGAVALMSLLGFTLNLLTLLAIVLAVGLVVDDAIVIVENVDRTIRQGVGRTRAALLASRELLGPVVAMTITLGAVYTPIGLQGGLTGALFREFAFTLACAVMVSGVVALTLSPVMSARILSDTPQQGWLGRAIDAAFSRLRSSYLSLLDWTLSRRWLLLACWALLSAAVVPMYMMSPTELAPTEDQGELFVAVDLPPDATLGQVRSPMSEVDGALQAVPELKSTWATLSPVSAFGGLSLVGWQDRSRSVDEVLGEVIGGLHQVAGVRATPILPSALPSAGTFPVDVLIVGALDHSELLEVGYAVREAVMESGQFAFPPLIDLQFDQTEAEIELDRPLLSSLGLTAGEVGAAVSLMTSGAEVGRFRREGRAHKVIPMVQRADRLVPEQLLDIPIAVGGEVLPLGAVADLNVRAAPRTLNRFAQFNAVRLSGVPTRSLGEALAALEAAIAPHLERGVTLDYAGESRQFRQEAGRFLPAMGFAVLLIFLVLAVQFNSLRDPIVILAGSVPLAMFGALIFTFLKFSGPPGAAFTLTEGWTTTLNVYSQVGLVTLVGLVAKNGILLVEFANLAQQEGRSRLEAVRVAASIRLRPILMTTAATVIGHFPLTLVSGPGAGARNSVGLILVGGMLFGTIFTLVFLPSLYVAFAGSRTSAERDGAPVEAEAVLA